MQETLERKSTPTARGHAVRWRIPQQDGHYPLRWTVHTVCGQTLQNITSINDTNTSNISCQNCQNHTST